MATHGQEVSASGRHFLFLTVIGIWFLVHIHGSPCWEEHILKYSWPVFFWQHLFREPEKRPPTVVSNTFTALIDQNWSKIFLSLSLFSLSLKYLPLKVNGIIIVIAWLTAYYVQCTVLYKLWEFPHLILTTAPLSKYYYSIQFTDY